MSQILMNEYESRSLLQLRSKSNIFAEADIDRVVRMYPSYRQIFIYPTGKREFINYKEALQKKEYASKGLSTLDHTLVANVDQKNKEIKVYMIPIVESA